MLHYEGVIGRLRQAARTVEQPTEVAGIPLGGTWRSGRFSTPWRDTPFLCDLISDMGTAAGKLESAVLEWQAFRYSKKLGAREARESGFPFWWGCAGYYSQEEAQEATDGRVQLLLEFVRWLEVRNAELTSRPGAS